MREFCKILDIQLDNPVQPNVLEKLVLPELTHTGTVVVSGRVPHWLRASAALSYVADAETIGCFAPGEGTPIVWSRNRNNIGNILDVQP